MKIFLKVLILSLILQIIISGCAGTKPKHFESGKIYVPLAYECQKNGFEWQYDTVTGVVTLAKGRKEIKLRRDSRLVIVNGSPEYLDLEIIAVDGVVLVPTQLVDVYMTGRKAGATLPQQGFHEIKLIVLDPGHGGRDPGAVGKNGLKEKNLTLDIATRVKEILDGNGIKIILTRQEDVFIPLEDRAQIANRDKADLFVSIHSNSSRAKRASGFEAFYLSEKVDSSLLELVAEENSEIGSGGSSAQGPAKVNATVLDMISDENRAESMELAKTICDSADELLPVKNRGAKGANFCVLRNARMPAVLVEIGFISNRKEGTKLNDDYYKQMVAEAVAAGILAYKKRFETTNGFTN